MRAFSVEDWPAFDFDREWESVRNLYTPDLSIPKFRDDLKEFNHLSLEPEVRERGFRTTIVVASHPELLDYFRRGRENGLAISYQQPFNTAEWMLLTQVNEVTLRLGEGRF